MKIFERYIAKNLITTILLVMIALLGVDLFFYTVNELRYLGKGQYSMGVMCLFLFFKIPTKLYTMFPWSVILGSLLALGNLAKSHELIAMQAAAISVRKISIAAIKGVFLLVVVLFFIGEYVAPKTENIAQSKKTQAISSGKAICTSYGIWVRNNNEFLHINTVVSEHELKGVTRYEFDDNLKLKEISVAKSAQFIDGQWLLKDVQSTKITKNNTYAYKEQTKVMHELFDKEILETTGVKHLERLSLKNLFKAIKIRRGNDLNAIDYELAFWSKIFQPFVILIMVFVVIPFIFGPLRSSTIGLKILTGVFVGFTLHTLNTVFAPLTMVINIPPILAVSLPAILFFFFGCYLTTKIRN